MSTGWAAGPMCAFDTESTGVDPTEARIVTACTAIVNAGTPTVPGTWLVNPGVDIPEAATAVHGITTEHAREHGQDPAVAVAEIRRALDAVWAAGIPVVAYNAAYDLTILDAELRRHGHPPLTVGPVIDPLVLDRALDRYRRGSRKLVDACRHYRVALDGAHDATQDALAAARIAWRIGQTYPDIAALHLDDLMTLQADMHRDWAEHFQAYLRGKGSAEVIDTAWPLRAAVPA